MERTPELIAAKHNYKTLYQTPMGTFPTWEAAADACERADFDPCTCIEIKHFDYTDVICETAYGSTVRLSNAVRVF